MASKFLSLTVAVNLIEDGMTLAISGNMEMSPMALIREVIRAEKRSLSLVCVGAAINADLLLGSSSVRTVEFSQISMGEFGFAPHFRRRFEKGSIEGLEHACPSLISAIQAGAMGIPFIPVRGLIGTDYMNIRPDFKQITNPYDEQEQIVIVPAISSRRSCISCLPSRYRWQCGRSFVTKQSCIGTSIETNDCFS